ncbi:mitotic checkpoint protein BUB3 [Salpingoeca rosetta]|uniref:Mitotic checkpoint protein BUB3 n=1 Tax=Salpingoeca rosetta (strain ATCC 50818 / BSB-021) TaxID=946362 RepID=F2ULS7_SALR5|nr:mitotic checkpoint protein BUB3 [Salpingoeca rosetta]EGD78076.1 mitotic checkpoint protein BUB3 [Salpingoeca rosetta]|eukprot:XP_004989752.1 mitotic checkpoint protein BUB3 [Salpingoeca rosetta]
MTDTELVSPPQDGISSVVFSPTSNLLLVASWDKTCRLYDVDSNTLKFTFSHDAPVLDCAFLDDTTAFGAGIDKQLHKYDLTTGKSSVVGSHSEAIKCVECSIKHGVVITGSWDKTIKLWNLESLECVGEYAQPDKVYTMALADDRVIVGMAGRHVWVWNLNNMSAVEQRRESSVKFQTRCIRAMPDAQGYVLASIEGRVAVDYLDPSESSQKRKFAFKCHRSKENGRDVIYPVNAVAFHPTFGTFATGGCDGLVNVWDGVNRKRVYQFHEYPTSIASLSFNHDGSLLAIAASYTYEEGDKPHPPDAIFIRRITEENVKPKPRS